MITFDQIKKDIRDGKVSWIYYSSNTLWWTHLESDLIESRKLGREASKRSHDKLLASNRSDKEKKKMSALFEMAQKGSHPLDPSGSPLMMTEETNEWMDVAKQKPSHFGKHGLNAFMKSHHQNCNNKCHPEWGFYNKLIDDEAVSN